MIGIASRTPQKAAEFAARQGIERGFGSYEALLECKDIDAVYIALPPCFTPRAKDDFRLNFELGGGAALDVGCYSVSCLP